MLGRLVLADSHGSIEATQRQAWVEEIAILREAIPGVVGTVFLEFDVPRLGSRIDAAIVAGPAVFAIEFKCGESRFSVDAFNQTWDYGLDLKNFHRASHDAPIFPVLVATAAKSGDDAWTPPHADGVRPPRRCLPGGLRRAMDDALSSVSGPPLDGDAWGRAPYQPTPTIIDAARALYARHTVDAITRNDAGAKNGRGRVPVHAVGSGALRRGHQRRHAAAASDG